MFTLYDSKYSEKVNVEGFRFLFAKYEYVPFGINALGDLFLLRKEDKPFHMLETQGLTLEPIEADVNRFFNNFLVNPGVIDSALGSRHN